MEPAKYITFKNEFGLEDIAIFSTHTQHAEMARNRRLFRNILGAGFISFGVEQVPIDGDTPVDFVVVAKCYGKSISLGDLESRGELDAAVAKKMLGLG